jgi:hypothetical protein
MSLNITELFGYARGDTSDVASEFRRAGVCPFVEGPCIKRLKSGLIAGACTLKPVTSEPVICCPNRMYAEDYRILQDVAVDAFGEGVRLCRSLSQLKEDKLDVMVFGKRWGKELRLPNRGKGGGYFVDWILALVGPGGTLMEFVAVEVQTMDTTGSYEAEARALLAGEKWDRKSTAGINWENVSKRILPQIIFKGHVLRNEILCKKGLYFVCPGPVYGKVLERLGGNLRTYHQQAGALTFRWYSIGEEVPNAQRRLLAFGGQMTTTVDQVALAFTSPTNLPDAGVYEAAIKAVLGAAGAGNSNK